jgi:hypothetical protein
LDTALSDEGVATAGRVVLEDEEGRLKGRDHERPVPLPATAVCFGFYLERVAVATARTVEDVELAAARAEVVVAHVVEFVVDGRHS